MLCYVYVYVNCISILTQKEVLQSLEYMPPFMRHQVRGTDHDR